MEQSQKNMITFLDASKAEIIEDWLNGIYEENNYSSSVYSPQFKDELKTDSWQTAGLVLDYFVDRDIFYHSLDDWLSHMYDRRMNNDVPLPEVIVTLDKLRRQFIRKITDYCIADEEVTKQSFAIYVETVNKAFDRINEAFSNLYYQEIKQNMESQSKLLEKISTPVITLTDKLAILPLMGDIDLERAHSIVEITASKCVAIKVEELCIDFSGVSSFDDGLGEMLANLVNVLHLLGVSIIISGIKPRMAEQISKMDLPTGLNVYHSLKEVLHEKKFTKLIFFASPLSG